VQAPPATDEHEQAAPQHVGDVQAAATDLRVAGGGEVEAHPEHGGDRGHQQQLHEIDTVLTPGDAPECPAEGHAWAVGRGASVSIGALWT
jgi:hypothetical protein